ncbi:hypothetical protein HRbin04_00395 [archaeon HR04]|nr:hypothetical protein HRbin04_00395 [archaeon HR04]
MREYNICIIKTEEPHLGLRLHLGSGSSLESTDLIIHSDTIFNGLCWAYRELYGEVELKDLLKDIINHKILLISSAFPLSDDVFYFPKPLHLSTKMLKGNDESKTDYKKIKSARFISKDLFEDIINERVSEYHVEKGFIHKEKEKVPIIKTSIEYRNRLDRISYSSDIYRCGYTLIENGAYWFSYSINDKYMDRLRASLRLLADNGFGGERSIGLGKASIEFRTVNIDEPEAPNRIISLSLYHPTREEVSRLVSNAPIDKVAYSLITRGGWTDPRVGSIRKKRVRCFEEGSVLPLQPYAIYGSVTNVNDDKMPIYHYGLCYSVGMI